MITMWKRISNSEACEWCQSLQGESKSHKGIDFRRHPNCKCIIINERTNLFYGGHAKEDIWYEHDFRQFNIDYDSAIEMSFEELKYDRKLLSKDLDMFYGRETKSGIVNVKNKKALNALEDIKDEMLLKAKPGKGKIVGEFSDPNPEIAKIDKRQANWLIETFGGTIKPITRSNIKGKGTADCYWACKLFYKAKKVEFKSSNGSKSSINGQIKKAIKKQIKQSDVLMLEINSNPKRPMQDILAHIQREASYYNLQNIIVKQNSKLIAFYKLK